MVTIYKGYHIAKGEDVAMKPGIFVANRTPYQDKSEVIKKRSYEDLIRAIDTAHKEVTPSFLIIFRDGKTYFAPLEQGAWDYGVGDPEKIWFQEYEYDVFKKISFVKLPIDELPF